VSQQTLRWGFLGTAHINQALIPPLRASKRNQLVAVASRTQKSAEAYARKWKVPRAYASYEAMLADQEIDVIYNSLPNSLHAEWTIKAVEAGKHVLCEKPLATTTNEVDAIAVAAAKYKKVVTEAFMYRHHPQTLQVKEIVDSGVLGQLQLIKGAFTFVLTRQGNFRTRADMGGGSIWDVGCYPISYACMLLGAEPVEVFGWQLTGPGGADETFIGQMRFPGDVYAQFDSGFRSPFRTQIEIVGAAGTLSVPVPFKPGRNEKIYLTRGEKTEMIRVPGQELYIGEVEDIAEAILLNTPPLLSLADSRANVVTIRALLESVRTGIPVIV
jgi:xylose dehydrogenase (NAD/NADP)